MAGSVATGLIFAVSCFSGVEATAIFRDEVRDPEKTIPRATYLAIAMLTIFYTVGSWAFIQALGEADAVRTIAAHPSTAFFDMVARYLGKIGRAHSELQSLMRISYAVFCLKKKTSKTHTIYQLHT